MTASPACPRCGAALAAAEATCPRCLFRAALRNPAPDPGVTDDAAAAGEERSAPSPRTITHLTAEEVAAALPEYEDLVLLGQGGMGSVFRARERALARPVAIKVLPRELGGDPRFKERFLREARALARLVHPNIVTVHACGESRGVCYLVMELVEGSNLRALMRAERLAPRQALAIVRGLCDALQYAHDEGVVHRDIKPENVLVDRAGRVKIADFGLAKLTGAPESQAHLTRGDQVLGTPHYMAPEQLERPREVDHRADLFALGVVLYEMLTGSLPRGAFEPPSARVAVDVRLDEIVLKALERDPARRYQHALEVKTDVERVERGPAARTARTEAALTLPAPLPVEPAPPSKAAQRPAPDAHADNPAHARLGWRGFALSLGFWIVFAALWNFGPYTLIAGAALYLGLVAMLVHLHAREEPELSAAIDAQSGLALYLRRLAAPLLALLSLAALVLGHLAIWENGNSSWTPSYSGETAALERWQDKPEYVASWCEIDARPPARAAVVLLSRTSSWPPGTLPPGTGWWSLGLGALLLALTVRVALDPGEDRELRRRAWHLAGWVVTCALGALVSLWILAPILDLRREVEKRSVDATFEVAQDLESVASRLQAAWTAHGLEATLRQRALVQVESREDGSRRAELEFSAASAPSPFERWRTSWSGAQRDAPALWTTLAPTPTGTRVRLELGLYEPGSPGAERARNLAAAIERALTLE